MFSSHSFRLEFSRLHINEGKSSLFTSYELNKSKTHTGPPYQLPLHVLIARRANEDGVLHEANEAPEGVAFILDLSEQGCHQVRHALAVAHVWIKHCIVEQNSPVAGRVRGTLVLP